MKQKKKLSGFTLIELLVVISIIGILSSFAVVSLNSARAKARDALRKGDMAQMRTAIMLYYDENNAYPICNPAVVWKDADPDFGAAVAEGSVCYTGSFKTALTTGVRPYINPMPKDPLNPTNDPAVNATYLYRYVSKADGSEYALVYRIEDNADLQVIRGW